MKADKRFQNLPKSFWADVKVIGEVNGYSIRKKKGETEGKLKIPTLKEIIKVYKDRSLNIENIVRNDKATEHTEQIIDYFTYRASILENYIEPRLMNAEQAKAIFEELCLKYNPQCPIPMNKQKGEKRAPAYLTSIINILIEAHLKDRECDYDPKRLATITRDGIPIRTLSRRVDGAYPSTVNPIALWEIKEYYYTTTFGSRVAGGVYETLLDGMELEELYDNEGIKVYHYLMVDAYFTWWIQGKSYLCRMIDMLHMNLADEILFGFEVIERLPKLISEWIKEDI